MLQEIGGGQLDCQPVSGRHRQSIAPRQLVELMDAARVERTQNPGQLAVTDRP